MSSDKHSKPDATEATQRRSGISTKAKAIIATLTAIVTLATGTLTLRDQISPDDEPEPTPKGSDRDLGGAVADVTNDAEAKTRATRVSDALKECVSETGRGYDGCNTGGILGAIRVPIGSGMGAVQVNVTSPATFELTSRSESGNTFRLQNFVSGEQVRTCTPRGSDGCPEDGRW